VPRLSIFLIIKILAPLDQVVDFVLKIIVLHFHQVSIIEGIIIKLFEFFGCL
jgi:hypothetical protein